jgi:hypothetical protein
LTDDKNRSEIDAVIEGVKHELRSLFVKSDEQIKKVGHVFKKRGFKEEDICEEIKNALKEEIDEGVISTRTIELHCPPEWKHKTKPKNEKTSFSKPVEEKPQPEIAVTHEGKSVIMNATSSDTETYPKGTDGVHRHYDQSKQNGKGTGDNNEEGTGDTDGKIAPTSKQPEEVGTVRKKEVFVLHIPISFEHLQKDMAAVFQITKRVGNVLFKVSVDLGTRVVKIEFC